MSSIRARYKGNGNEHINGVPMKDIDEDAWELLSSEEREDVRTRRRADGQHLYDVATNKEMSGSPKKAPAHVAEPEAEPEAVTPPPDEGSGG